jgi:putative heme-binding domain-containing protein
VVRDDRAPEGKRVQTWHFPGRAECLLCHNPWVGQTLAFTLPQLHRDHDHEGAKTDQLATLRSQGMLVPASEQNVKPDHPLLIPKARLSNPSDSAVGINDRARSYLHANCSHCHQFGAGGTANIDMRFDQPLHDMRLLEARPVQGNFDIPNANLIAPGDPYRSVLYYRMAKTGRGRMPHVGSELVDEMGLRLIADWIRQLPNRKDERQLVTRLGEAKGNTAQRTEAIKRLLSSTSSALLLLEELDSGNLPATVRNEVVTAAVAHEDGQIRDLFERFVPENQRVKRLGSVIKPEQILALQGDVARGRELFFKSGASSCASCHRVGEKGTALGPELTDVGKRLQREEILESILEPSKKIDARFVGYVLETKAGVFHQGLLVEKNERETVLKAADGKEIRIPTATVERLAPQSKSLMPELLLRDLSAQQAADLLAYLTSLK